MPEEKLRLRKINEGREAEMFAWEGGRILRLFRGNLHPAKAEFQIRAQEAAREAGIRVPAVFEMVKVNGRLGVIMERIEGTDLLTMIGRKPWRLRWVGDVVGRAHAEINSARAPDSIPALIGRYAWLIEHAPGIPPAYAEAALARLKELPEGDRLVHGDFHPGNVMMHEGRPVILDWSNAARGSPEADLARTRLLMSMADPPPGTPAVVRVAALFARSVLGNAHLKAYRRTLPTDEALLQRWELPVAVARWAEADPKERSKLTAYIEARLARDLRTRTKPE